MHKNFLKILPLAAAVLFATSCSKDENNETVENNEVINSETSLELPFSVTVKTGSSLSKIKCDDDGTTSVTTKFDDKDIDNGVLMIVKGDYISDGSLTLTKVNDDGVGEFTGKLKFATEDDKSTFLSSSNSIELSATVEINKGAFKWSVKSLEDLIENCEHTYNVSSSADEIAPFYYGDEGLVLYDNNAYLEFVNLAEGQRRVEVSGMWYPATTSTEIISSTLNKIWVAVPMESVSDQSITVTTRLKPGSKTVSAGTVYTVKCDKNVVDLGRTVDGKIILWKTQNEGDGVSSPTDYGSYYNWSTACSTFGTSISPKAGSSYRLPTKKEFEDLVGVTGTGSGWQKSSPQGWTFANEYGSLFLPAAGRSGGGAGNYGYYWSGTGGGGTAFDLRFSTNYALVDEYGAGSGYSVRLVRGL